MPLPIGALTRFLSSTNLFLVLALFFITVYGVNPSPSPTYEAMAIGTIFSVAGCASSSSRLHGAIAGVAFLNMAVQMAVQGFRAWCRTPE